LRVFVKQMKVYVFPKSGRIIDFKMYFHVLKILAKLADMRILNNNKNQLLRKNEKYFQEIMTKNYALIVLNFN
jgi:hypothetical protein